MDTYAAMCLLYSLGLGFLFGAWWESKATYNKGYRDGEEAGWRQANQRRD